MKIGNVKIDEKKYKMFVFDGCHKFYLIDHKNPNEQIDVIKSRGYDESDIYPLQELPEMFRNACPLRFISYWDLTKNTIVPQGRKNVSFRTDYDAQGHYCQYNGVCKVVK